MATILEGTWEEIKGHDSELAGRHVRLIVEPAAGVDEDAAAFSVQSKSHLEDLLLPCVRNGPTTPMTDTDWEDIRVKGRELPVSCRPSVA